MKARTACPQALTPGDEVNLKVAPRLVQHAADRENLLGHPVTVRRVYEEVIGGRSFSLAEIETRAGEIIRDVPTAYCFPAPKQPSPPKDADNDKEGTNARARKKPFFLHEPKDERSERERQDEGVAWLRGLGYRVLETDKRRGQAICTKHRQTCRCPICHSPGFAVSTGGDKGITDLEIQHPRWPGRPIVTLCVDYKDGPKAKRTPEQAERERRGEIAFAWDCPSLARVLIDFETSVGVVPLADVTEKAGNR